MLQKSKRNYSDFEEEQIVTEDKPVLIAIKEIEGHEINILEPDEDEL